MRNAKGEFKESKEFWDEACKRCEDRGNMAEIQANLTRAWGTEGYHDTWNQPKSERYIPYIQPTIANCQKDLDYTGEGWFKTGRKDAKATFTHRVTQ